MLETVELAAGTFRTLPSVLVVLGSRFFFLFPSLLSLCSPLPSDTMPTISVLSYNIKGLNTPEKRSLVLQEVKKLKADIVFLLEIHFRADSIPRLCS